MPPALIGGVIAGGAALLSSSKNSKAINKATDAQTKSDADQIAFQRQAYAQNTANLTPWMTSGLAANSLINSALGIPTAPQGVQQGAPPGALTVPYNGGYPDAGQYPPNMGGLSPQNFNPYQQGVIGEGGIYGAPYQGWHGGPNQPGMMSVASAPADPAQAAQSAYEIFKQSMGYQTRLQEGQRGQGALYSAQGVYQSGARDKALARFNQNFASNEFGNWLGQVGNQQGLGFAGASALAGVSQGNADRMGAISQNSAQFAGQAAVARAQNSGALFSGLAGIAGNAFGALSSYR